MNTPLYLGVITIAIVLRGDRGLELQLQRCVVPPNHCDRSSGRSRIGTIFLLTCSDRVLIAIVLRGDRGLERLIVWW